MPAPQIPTRSNGLATHRRILDAATTEFARYGIAGARVDRIVAEAGANKSQLYGYFRSKDELFDVVLMENVEAIIDTVPLDGKDLPGYATGLYDAYLGRPEMVRLAAWNRLERRPEGRLFEDGEKLDAGKLQSIVDAQGAGLVRGDLDAADIHSLVIAMALAWAPVSFTYAATTKEPGAPRDRRRTALGAAVAAAFAPHPD